MAKCKRTVEVKLNGTNVNPWHNYGLTQNPFPQAASYEETQGSLRLQKLGGDPIPHAEPGQAQAYIEKVLEGFSPEFIALCVKQFQPGKMVKFEVFWEE